MKQIHVDVDHDKSLIAWVWVIVISTALFIGEPDLIDALIIFLIGG